MNKTNNYSELYDYFEQLTDESKIHFSYTIFKNSIEEVNEVLENNMFGTFEELISYEDFDEEDSENLQEELPEELEKLFELKKKEDSEGNPPMYVIMDLDNNKIHIYSDTEKDIDKFIYRTLFLKGMFFIQNKNAKPKESIEYKKYRCIDILGQLEQDICYN